MYTFYHCPSGSQEARAQRSFERRNAQVGRPRQKDLSACAAGASGLARLLGRKDHAVLRSCFHPRSCHRRLFEQGRAPHLQKDL